MNNQKLKSRAITFLLALIMIVTMIPLTPQIAYANTDGANVVFDGFGGGSGHTTGSVGTGQWNENMQGIRISIVNHFGEPAFEFRGRDSLDIIFGTDRLGTVTHFISGPKTSPAVIASPSMDGLNAYVITLANLQAHFKNGFGTILPDGRTDNIWLKLNNLPQPLTSPTKNSWVIHGAEIFKFMNGGAESGKMGVDAQLRTIVNIYQQQADGTNMYLWQPKEALSSSSTGYSNTTYYNPITGYSTSNTESAKKLNQRKNGKLGFDQGLNAASGLGGVTAEELAALKIIPGQNGAMAPTKVIENHNYAILVEPIIWNRLRKAYGTKNDWTNFVVYGTQSNIASVIDSLDSSGALPERTKGWQYGGSDAALFGASGRKAMTLTAQITFPFRTDVVSGILTPSKSPLTISPPTGNLQPAQEAYVSNKDMYSRNIGWGVHIFFSSAPSVPSTSTCDEPLIPTPHTAPDPSKIPKLPDEQVDKTRVYNIVKTYRDRVLDELGNEVVEHVTTNTRQKNPSRISIEDEKQYKVKEWFISETYNNPTSSTTWEDNHNQAPTTGPTGKGTGTTEIKPKNTTLYVLLEKDETIPPLAGSLVIEESQVTKAVETMTSPVDGWGPQTMTFKANDISGACPYMFYHSCEDCSYSWQCGAPYVLNDRAWNYNHRNSTSIDKYIHADGGVFKPINDRGTDAKGERDTVSEYTNFVDTFNYKLVVWRGEDVPTIANYKEQSSNPLNTLVKRYGKEPAGQRYGTYSGKSTSYNRDLLITLDKDGGLGDYTTTSVTDHGYSQSATHANINTLNYDTPSTVKVYYGKAHEKGNLTAAGTQAFTTTLVGKPSAPKYSGGQMKQSGEVTWYPYIRMTYQTTGVKDPTRTNVNILSQYISELTPNDYVEAAWVSTKDYNMNLKSAQWSLHSRATAGDKGWNQSNRVLPGGALYSLDTKNTKTWASVITWQPYLEEEVRNKVVFKGVEYEYGKTQAPHDAFVEEAKKALEGWRVVQYVKTHDSDGKTSNLKSNTNTTLVLDGVKISGGGQNLSGLTGLTGKTNTEDKYYMKPASTSEKANEGDIDILSTTTIEIKYKVTADVEGKIHVYRDRDSSGWQEIFTLNKNQDQKVLTGEALALDQRTKVITNLCTVLTRNSGSDKTAAWAKSDGKWYNEAFDGICYTRRETSFELGYKTPNQRSAALDPALCPPNSGQSDLFTKAFLSQFFMNDKSDAYPDKGNGFIGTFKGMDVVLAGHKEMFKSMPFAIPNVNVQDLN